MPKAGLYKRASQHHNLQRLPPSRVPEKLTHGDPWHKIKVVGGVPNNMNTGPFLECSAVSKSFGKHPTVQALAEVTFSINVGELVCITGSSGSGKTTLLTIIGSLQRPTSGEIIVQGKSLNSASNRETARLRARHIGFIFQSPALVPVLNASENIECALQFARPELSQGQRQRLVDEALEITNLESRRHLRPGQLSGGECQRVAIARAVVKRPALI